MKITLKIPRPNSVVGEEFDSVTGTIHTFPDFPGIQLLAYKATRKLWRTIEVSTGLSVGGTYASTKTGSLAKAKTVLDVAGFEKTKQVIADRIRCASL